MSAATEHRKLAAIMFTDMVGYSALSQRNEALALELLEEHRALLRPLFPRFNGSEIKTIGDAFLVEFQSALEAAQCGIEIQRALAKRNADAPPDRRIELKIGIHIGDVVHRGGDVYGDGVNIASRIEPLAGAGGICVSMDVERQIRNALEARFERLGPAELRNISVPMELFRIVLPWEKQDDAKLAGKFSSVQRRRKPVTLRMASVVGGSVLLALIATGVFLYERADRKSGAARASRVEWLVVLPLRNYSGDTNQDFFVDGMTDILNGELAQLGGLQVKSHTTAMRYKGTTKSVPEIGRELNVDAVVEGSVQRAGSQVLISVQLIEAATDRHLWQKKFQRDVTDVFKLQSEVTEAIAREIQARLTPQDEARLARARPVNPQALEAYLQGREQWNRRTPDSLRRAIALFQKSVELDPNFALGHAGLADAYCLAPDHLGVPTNESNEKARASALKAISLDDQLAEPHVSLGYLLVKADWKWREAESEFRRAIALKPNYPPAYNWFAYQLLVKLGRTNEALVHAETALKLDPVTPMTRAHYSMVLIAAGRREEAIEQARMILTLEPDFPLAHWNLLLAYLHLADYSAAISAGEQLRTKINRPWVWGKLGYAYATAGQKEPALKLLAELKSQPTNSLVYIAEIQAGLGMTQEALDNLELAFTQRSESLDWLRFQITFDNLRAEPRFQALLKKVGLEP